MNKEGFEELVVPWDGISLEDLMKTTKNLC